MHYDGLTSIIFQTEVAVRAALNAGECQILLKACICLGYKMHFLTTIISQML